MEAFRQSFPEGIADCSPISLRKLYEWSISCGPLTASARKLRSGFYTLTFDYQLDLCTITIYDTCIIIFCTHYLRPISTTEDTNKYNNATTTGLIGLPRQFNNLPELQPTVRDVSAQSFIIVYHINATSSIECQSHRIS